MTAISAAGATTSHLLLDLLIAAHMAEETGDPDMTLTVIKTIRIDKAFTFTETEDGRLRYEALPLMEAMLYPVYYLANQLAHVLDVSLDEVVADTREYIENNRAVPDGE